MYIFLLIVSLERGAQTKTEKDSNQEWRLGEQEDKRSGAAMTR